MVINRNGSGIDKFNSQYIDINNSQNIVVLFQCAMFLLSLTKKINKKQLDKQNNICFRKLTNFCLGSFSITSLLLLS